MFYCIFKCVLKNSFYIYTWFFLHALSSVFSKWHSKRMRCYNSCACPNTPHTCLTCTVQHHKIPDVQLPEVIGMFFTYKLLYRSGVFWIFPIATAIGVYRVLDHLMYQCRFLQGWDSSQELSGLCCCWLHDVCSKRHNISKSSTSVSVELSHCFPVFHLTLWLKWLPSGQSRHTVYL